MPTIIDKSNYQASNDDSYQEPRVLETVDTIVMDPSDGEQAATMHIGDWSDAEYPHQLVVGFQACAQGPTTGHITGTRLFMGLTPSHAQRYGQAGEYCAGFELGNTDGATWTASTYGATIPPNITHQYSAASRTVLANAGSRTRSGSLFGFAVPQSGITFSDANSYTDHPWQNFLLFFRRLDAVTLRVGWQGGQYPNINSWLTHQKCACENVGASSTTNGFWAVQGTKVMGFYGMVQSFADYTIDETTYGSLDYLSVVFDNNLSPEAKFLFRNLTFHWSRPGYEV